MLEHSSDGRTQLISVHVESRRGIGQRCPREEKVSNMIPREYPDFYINGAWRKPESSDIFQVVSPASGRPIGFVPAASEADIDAAVAAAHRAFYETDWPDRPVHERAELCRKLAAALAERQEEFAELIVAELGCTKFLADVYEAAAPTLHWNYAADVGENYRFSEVRVSDLSPLAAGGGGIVPFGGKSLVVKEPVGVAALFCAYNFALPAVGQKAGPALVAGCTVIIKVPEQNPLAIFGMGALLTEVGFPPGVINIVAAGPEASEHLIRHPAVDIGELHWLDEDRQANRRGLRIADQALRA